MQRLFASLLFCVLTFLVCLFSSSSRVYAIGQFGSHASLVIGQPGLNGCASGRNGADYSRGLYTNNTFPRIFDGKLFMPDAFNGRVLVYNTFPDQNNVLPDSVIAKHSLCTYSMEILAYPINVAYDGNNFLVSDYVTHRIAIYKGGIPSADQIPDAVIGQVSYSLVGQGTQYTAANQGGSVAANTLNAPYGMQIVNGKLIVADRSNHRVLIYNSVPSSSNASADVVIGQPDMTSNTANNGGRSSKSLNTPRSVYSNGTNLIIGDSANHRVLIFNTIPTTNFTSADVVVGQPDFTSGTANNGGISAATLNNPYDVTDSNGKLFIADNNNNRVLIFNSIPTSNGASANVVVGQQTFLTNLANQGGARGANTLAAPSGIAVSGDTLFISELSNNRILKFNTIPTSNNASADNVIGQVDFTYGTSFQMKSPSASNLNLADHASYTDGRLFVHDYGNHRILVYNTLPITSGASADIVIGQSDMSSNTTGVSSTRVGWATSIDAYAGKLLWSDGNRVLLYNSLPTATNTPADLVLGQPDFSTNTANNGGLSARSFSSAFASYDGTRVYVADASNNRVLIYNSFPISNFAPADVVIGQPNMTSNTINNGGISASSLNAPRAVINISGKLYISDSGNNRVLIYNTIPTTNFAPADVVIGQPNMASNVANNGGIGSNTLNFPFAVKKIGNGIAIADYTNNRVLIYADVPTSNGASANAVIGQGNFTSNFREARDYGLNGPWDIVVTEKKLGIADAWNDRIVFFDLGPKNESVTVAPMVNTVNSTIKPSAVDAKDILISESSDFSGATWQPYATSIPFTLSNGDGVKTIYAKYRDFANIEGNIITTSTVLDTTKPSINITDLGLISNVPDKTPLFYYFTSQTPRIKGITEAGSTVHFKYGSNDYTTVADASGNYTIDIPELPRQYVTLEYYAVDQAGNQSETRKLNLMIGEENFPKEMGEQTGTVTITPPISVTPTPVTTGQPTTEPEQMPQSYELTIVDQDGNPIPDAPVFINDQKYIANANGKIYVEKSLPGNAIVYVEIKGVKQVGSVNGSKIIVEIQEEKFNAMWNWWWILLIIIIIFVGYKKYKSKK